LPVEEYRTLHTRAYPIERDPEPPPVEATLTRVDYDLRIDGELASGRASLTVDVLKDGWVRVPIPAGLLVREARLDGKLVSLVPSAGGKAGGQLSALLSHSGRAVLLIDIAIPVASATGEEKDHSAFDRVWRNARVCSASSPGRGRPAHRRPSL
jgi:hypothetical protein